METVVLGSTGIKVNKNGFGALPIQRVSTEDAVKLARKAYEAGITFFDTARFYTDSEEKLGEAFDGMHEKVYIATKTAAKNADEFWEQLGISLHNLRTDYIDIYQFHNPSFCPKPGDGTGLYEAMLEAKAQGKIRHIGITNHRLAVAEEAIESGLYETLQFPFCYLATDKDIALVEKCKKADMGFIAMKVKRQYYPRFNTPSYISLVSPITVFATTTGCKSFFYFHFDDFHFRSFIRFNTIFLHNLCTIKF